MDRHQPPIQVPAATAPRPGAATTATTATTATPKEGNDGAGAAGHAPAAVDVPRLLRLLSVRHASDVFLGEIAAETVATPSLNGASAEELMEPSEFCASSRGGGFRIAIDSAEYDALKHEGAVVVSYP
ncbi:MAG: hypothetical protein ABJA82_16590 [Myxococcales bacterium]